MLQIYKYLSDILSVISIIFDSSINFKCVQYPVSRNNPSHTITFVEICDRYFEKINIDTLID